MSENFYQDQFVKRQLAELEKARQILCGIALKRRFRPLYFIPVFLVIASFLILDTIGVELNPEVYLILVFMVFLMDYEWKLRIVNKKGWIVS